MAGASLPLQRLAMRGLMGRGRGQNAYAVLLLVRLFDRVANMRERPPVTMFLLFLQVGIYLLTTVKPSPRLAPLTSALVGAIRPHFLPRGASLHPAKVLAGESHRLLLAAFVHLSHTHILHNMLSLVQKASLERRIGSRPFLFLVLYLALASHALYTAIAFAAARLGLSARWMRSSVAGFSGVLFGLSAIINASPRARADAPLFGLRAPMQRMALELVMAQVAVPNASFLGHACGIIAGLVFVVVRSIFKSSYIGSLSFFALPSLPWLQRAVVLPQPARRNYGGGVSGRYPRDTTE